MIKKILNFIFGKEKELEYPIDFAIIDFSPIALENGIIDNQNKIITRYYYDKYGNLQKKIYRYCEERVFALQEIYKIPIYDKTSKPPRFPVFGRLLPGEITYTSR